MLIILLSLFSSNMFARLHPLKRKTRVSEPPDSSNDIFLTKFLLIDVQRADDNGDDIFIVPNDTVSKFYSTENFEILVVFLVVSFCCIRQLQNQNKLQLLKIISQFFFSFNLKSSGDNFERVLILGRHCFGHSKPGLLEVLLVDRFKL